MAKMAISFFGTSPTNGEFVMVISPFSIGYVVRKPPLDHDYLMGDMGDAGGKTTQALHGDTYHVFSVPNHWDMILQQQMILISATKNTC